MTTPSGEGTDGGSSGAPPTPEAPAPEKSSGDTSAAAPESSSAPGKPAEDSADEAPAPESTSEPTPPSDAAGASGDTTANQDPPGDPAGDDAQERGPGGAEQPGQAAPADGSEEDVPGTTPGADMKEVNNEDTRPRPGDDDFIGPVAPEDQRNDSTAGSLQPLIEQLQGTKRDSEVAHSEGDRGSRDVVDSWLDPNQDPARDRTGRTLDETKGVGDSADALGQQVGRSQEQIDAALREIEKSDQDAGSVDLLRPLLGAGESEVVDQRTQDMAAAERERIANLTAEQIRNDPAWDQWEAPPADTVDVSGLITGSSTAAAAGADTVNGVRADLSKMAAPDLMARGDLLDARANIVDWMFDGRYDKWSQATKAEAAALLDAAAEHQSRAEIGKSLSHGLKVGGVVGAPFAVAGAVNDYYNGGESAPQAIVSNGVGLGTSVATGAAVGAAVGSFIPVPIVGTAVGAGVGALAGTVAGAFTSGMVDSFFENGFDVGRAAENGWTDIVSAGEALWGGAKWLTGNE
ncbi:hypothetical protein L3Q67_44010 [Saccharothrix sp. AJ9571]|nr:hypothetical protein L3Q67_44010 [Saccharothrix sp. AJ9571]